MLSIYSQFLPIQASANNTFQLILPESNEYHKKKPASCQIECISKSIFIADVLFFRLELWISTCLSLSLHGSPGSTSNTCLQLDLFFLSFLINIHQYVANWSLETPLLIDQIHILLAMILPVLLCVSCFLFPLS